MSISKKVLRSLAVLATAVGIISAVVTVGTPQQAFAASTTCKTVHVSKSSITYSPYMTVPVCYNGSRIWQNGGVTPGVSLIGWIFGGYSWHGTYNSGGSWIGIGENFTITMELPPFVTISCSPRWILNAAGQVTSSSYGC